MKYLLKMTAICLAVVAGTQVCSAGAFEGVKSSVFDSGFYQPVQLFNESTNIYGMRLSFFMMENKDVYGLDTGFVNCSRNASGLQASVVNVMDEDNTGLAFGIVNYAGKRMFGMQTGLYNQTGTAYFDKTLRKDFASKGAQIGWLNHAQAIFKGCQMGMVNISDSYFSGIQIGVGNFIQNDDKSFEDFDTVTETENAIKNTDKILAQEVVNPLDKTPPAKKDDAQKPEAKKPETKVSKNPFSFQLGLINFNGKGFLPVFPIFNFSW